MTPYHLERPPASRAQPLKLSMVPLVRHSSRPRFRPTSKDGLTWREPASGSLCYGKEAICSPPRSLRQGAACSSSLPPPPRLSHLLSGGAGQEYDTCNPPPHPSRKEHWFPDPNTEDALPAHSQSLSRLRAGASATLNLLATIQYGNSSLRDAVRGRGSIRRPRGRSRWFRSRCARGPSVRLRRVVGSGCSAGG